jgi:hypothetical protein
VERDHERGAWVERSDTDQQPGGGRGVEAFGGLVEQQDVRAAEQALGDAEATALAAREGGSAGADRGVEPGREGGYGVVERGGGKCIPELRFACGGIGELKVVADGAVEDVRVLGDERDVLGERFGPDAGRVGASEVSVDAGGRLPADGSQDGRLAGS